MVDSFLIEKIFMWVSTGLFSIFVIIRAVFKLKIKSQQTEISYQKGRSSLEYLIVLEVIMYILYGF